MPRQAKHQRIQLHLRQRHCCAGAGWPGEPPLVQSSRGELDADAIVDQHLHAVCAAIGEEVGMMWLRGAEDSDDTRQSGIHAGAHVQRSHGQPDGINPDHRSHPCSQVAHSAAADAGQRTATMAAPRRISITMSCVPAAVFARFNCRGTNSAG